MRAIVRLAGAGLVLSGLACGADPAETASADAAAAGAGGSTAGRAGAAGATSPAGGAAGKAGASGAGASGAPLAATPKGSFELHLSPASAPGAKTKPYAEEGAPRVDLSGADTAVVTPRWGSPAVFQVAEKKGALVLTGSVSLRSGDTTDTWQSFALELDAARRLTGKLSAVGQRTVFDGTVGASTAVTATGSLSDDDTAPDARLDLSPPFTGGARLPWEALAVRFSEPLAPSMISASLRVTGAEGPVEVAWTLGPAGGANGAVTATASLPSFDVGVDALSVRAQAGYADLAGNPGPAVEGEIALLPISPAGSLPGKLSAQAMSGLFTWGSAASSPDGGLALGPLALGSCGVAPAGVAGRAPLPAGASKLEVRYRVVAAPKAPGVSPVSGALPALSLLVGAPGAAPRSKEVLSPALTELTAEGALASPWTAVSVPVSADGGGEIGWALRAGALTSSSPCEADPSELSPVVVTVLVESVASK